MASTPQKLTPNTKQIRKLQKQRLKDEIKKTLSGFQLNQLMSETIVNLFELEPVEINYHLNELKLSFKKQSVVDLLGIRARAFNVEELTNLNNLLQLYRVAYYSKTKKWTPINLLEPEEDLQSPTDEDVIRRNLLQAFRIKGLNGIVNVITHNELVWVVIIGKKLTRKRGVKLQPPHFICYEVGTPYILAASSIPATIMECILKAMQYKKHKVHQLEGRDVKSLLFLLRNKAMNAGKNVVVPYEPAEAVVGHRYIDFTKRKYQETYVNNVFKGAEEVVLDTFTVTADTVWLNNSLVPGMAGEPFKTTLQFTSKNIVQTIKDMVARDMIATPLPEYMQSILRSAKNKVIMRKPK